MLIDKLKSLFSKNEIPRDAQDLVKNSKDLRDVLRGLDELITRNEMEVRDINQSIEELEQRVALKRWGDSDDVADVVLFFASEASRYVTGETITVDGGMAYVSASAAPAKLPELED